jgi:hypothetical protein
LSRNAQKVATLPHLIQYTIGSLLIAKIVKLQANHNYENEKDSE